MIINIDGLDVVFPFEAGAYPEQIEFMQSLKEGFDRGGSIILEMPSGTGKTMALLALTAAYLAANETASKVVYCTRTIPEIEKVLAECEVLLTARERHGVASSNFRAVGMSARKNLCIHPTVSALSTPAAVDSGCRARTASWVTNGAVGAHSRGLGDIEDAGECCFFRPAVEGDIIAPGVHSISSLRSRCGAAGICPYFAARRAMAVADIIVCHYQYIIDPKIAPILKSVIPPSSIILFDEAHNLDSVCLEALSVTLTSDAVEDALAAVVKLSNAVDATAAEGSARLQSEYEALVAGLRAPTGVHPADAPDLVLASPPAGAARVGIDGLVGGGALAPTVGTVVDASAAGTAEALASELMAAPVATVDFRSAAVAAMPGSLRRGKHFLVLFQMILRWFNNVCFRAPQSVVSSAYVTQYATAAFLSRLSNGMSVEVEPLKMFSERLRLLMNTLQISDLETYHHLMVAADFISLCAANDGDRGFVVIVDLLGDEADPARRTRRLQLVCCNAAAAMRVVTDRFPRVVFASGTLTPVELYEQMLGLRPVVRKSISASYPRECILPLVVVRGADNVTLGTNAVASGGRLTSRFADRADPAVVRNYGDLVLSIVRVVPDGVVIFFPSYVYMEECVAAWHTSGTLTAISDEKLLFVETADVEEAAVALSNFRTACDIGRGAAFIGVARGKVAEGIDFDGHYGRAVIVIGLPVARADTPVTNARCEWVERELGITKSRYLAFDAMRSTAQCIGRVIRNKRDYGVMVMADDRFRQDRTAEQNLPLWIARALPRERNGVASDVAVDEIRRFLLEMAVPGPL